ncbi:hypothetical protein CBS101457_006536 [Exobasidium rhododendri]|nr:hypothetical protein CBS101457_006536 [Exobasidium rhododendri]
MSASYHASDLSREALGTPYIRTFGRHFIDGYGRLVQMRGVNVSGATKLPAKPDGLQHINEANFFNHSSVSFVGRPFPLSEAPLHFARLKAWGLTLIRLLITWESLAHSGPDPETDMDEEYLEYLHELIAMMPKFGLKVILCAHQDVWSRFSGGSGAPAWTFEKAGLDIEAFKATGAAYNSKQALLSTKQSKRKPEPVGPFVWPSGYQKLAAASMATLFWAGERFAWKLELPHYNAKSASPMINIQEYLQSSYIECFGRLVDKVGNMDAVMGVDIMNEPHRGYVGATDWNKWNYDTDLHIGHFPSLLQSLALGSGYKQAIPFYVKSWPFPSRVSHKSIIDPLGKSAWLEDGSLGQCVWRAHGAWEWDKEKDRPVILREDFFTIDSRPGKEMQRVEWYRDCYAPFLKRFTERMRQSCPHLLSFVEPIPNEFFPPWSHVDTVSNLNAEDRLSLMKASYNQNYAVKTFFEVERPAGFVYAPHFYDLNVLFSKVHRDMSVNVQGLSRGMFILKALYFGFEGLQRNYMHQISTLKKNGQLSLGIVPMIIGEVGIPWDINDKKAYRTGDYSKHFELLDALIEAMEQNQIGFTLWNYNPDNTVKDGDGWNKEDFSIMCNDSRIVQDLDNRKNDEELYKGGRGLSAIIRPYAVKVAGFPFKTKWDSNKLAFEFHYVNGPMNALKSTTSGGGGGDGGGDDDKKKADSSEGELVNMQQRTEIYFPAFHFDGYEVRIQVKDGDYKLDRESQTLYLDHASTAIGFEHVLRINVLGPIPKKRTSGLQSWYQLSIQDTFTIGSLITICIFCIVVSDYVVKPLLSTVETLHNDNDAISSAASVFYT